VDAFFVMAYQMGGPAGSTSAQFGGSDFSAQEALQEYTQVVPASKVILGLPYYGYEWPTTGPGTTATVTGPATPVPDQTILASKQPVYWNQATGTAWFSSETGTQWYQTWFEDPASLALKAQTAGMFGARGVGIWSLGMDGNDPALLSALVGTGPVKKDFASAPGGNSSTKKVSRSTTTTRPGTTTTTDPGTSTTGTPTTDPGTSTTTTTQPSTTTTEPSTTTTEPSTTTTDPGSTTTTSTTQPTVPTTDP
jgi:GH18 family chitinase